MSKTSETEEQSTYEALSHKQRCFVDNYLGNGFNATRAARTAKYAHPHVQGPRLLGNVRVDGAIRERLATSVMSAEEVLARLTAIARGDMGDFFRTVEDSVTITRVDETTGEETQEERVYRYTRLDMLLAKKRGKTFLLKSYSRTQHGERIELYSASEALVQIGKHLGLFKEQVEHSGPGGGPIVISTDAIEQGRKELAEWRQEQQRLLESQLNGSSH